MHVLGWYALNVNGLCVMNGRSAESVKDIPDLWHQGFLMFRDAVVLLLDWHAPNVNDLWCRLKMQLSI